MIEWRGLGDAGSATAARSAAPTAEDELPPLRPRREPSRWRVLLEAPVLLLVAAVIAIVVKTFLAQAFFIPSASMEPQLTGGDRVVVSRMAYELHEPRRGDIVVFDDPLQVDEGGGGVLPVAVAREALEAIGIVRPDEKELIKRVIALPGETVSARDGTVHIDDRPLFEPYLPASVLQHDFPPYTVPAGHVFVMGDNRANSKDSRVFAAVPVDTIVGRAIATVWPPTRIAFL